MASAADIQTWEAAEIERSLVEAAQTPTSQFVYNDANLKRYLDPPANTPFPLEYAFHLLGDIDGKVVLDYGCGTGENSVPMAVRGANVIGIDLSQALLDLAAKRMSMNGVAGRGSFIAASAHSVPLPDNSVDVVLGVAVLHHLDLDVASREVHRLLKPGGRAIIKEPVRNSRLLKALRDAIPYKRDDVSPYERPLTDEELRRFAAPFTITRMRAFSLPFINLANVVPALQRHIMPLYRLDGAILRRAPFLDAYAGARVMELRK